MTRTLRLFVAALLVALALFAAFAASAFATLEDTPTPNLGTTTTNPGAGADAWWHEGWGNSLYPEFTLNPPGAWDELKDGYLLGTIYGVDRTYADPRSSYIDTTSPWDYDRDAFPTGVANPGGTNLDNTLDMLGIYLDLYGGSWSPALGGQNSPLEGQWYYHYAFYSNQRFQNESWTIPFGIDLTPPRAVTHLQVTTGLNGSAVTTWTPAKRARLTWDYGDLPGLYDDVSGIGYYQVLVDGKPFVPETSSSPVQGRVYGSDTFVIAPTFTIESMPGGAHKISVVPVDRAGNPAEGTPTSVWFYSDPDTPTISWADPTGGVINPSTGVISVNATDSGGDPVVTLSLGGNSLGTFTAPPYTVAPDLSHLATGTYTLTATATDHLNRTVTISKQVAWNPTGIAGSTTDPSVDVTTTPGTSTDSAASGTGWTNNLAPTALLAAPSGATDVFYDVAQTPTDVDTVNLQNYFHSLAPGGTQFDQTVNLKDSIDSPPPGGWAPGPSGAVPPYDGTWYFEWVWYNSNTSGVSSSTYRLKFNVDRTPPAAVTGFSAAPVDGIWTSSTRVNLTWDPQQYDALSGDAIYRIYLDDKPVASTSATSPIAGSATFEDMPAGKHKLSIAAVDMAGNVGPASSLYFMSDPDTPTISFTSPAGDILMRNGVISANAADAAGDPVVTFRLDSTNLATITAPPYSITPDLSHLATGTYTLTATATDHLNRTVTISKQVAWNPTGVAGLPTDPSVDVTTTPGTSTDSDSSGTGWTNNLAPTALLAAPSGATDVFYDIAQTATDLDTVNLQNYFHSLAPGGTQFNQTVDLKDSIDSPPPGGWAAGPAGAVPPYDGTWYFQWVWFNASTSGVSPSTYRLKFNVDRTPPAAVTGFSATPAAGAWTASTRVNLKWDPQQYDALSGDATYQIYLDDKPVASTSATNAVAGSATFEDMPAGKHKLSIAAVDMASNAGPASSLYFMSDPDTPTISITSPAGDVLTRNGVISANAADAGGDPVVTFRIDSTNVATITAPPYSFQPDLSGLATGDHVLRATATDHMGRTASVTKAVKYSNTQSPDPPGGLITEGGPQFVDVTDDAVSSSNPIDNKWRVTGAGTSAETAWGTNLHPDFTLPEPADIATLSAETSGSVAGMLYTVRRAPELIDANQPDAYYRSARPVGTDWASQLNGTLDLASVMAYPPTGGWPGMQSGAVLPIEGTWYVEYTPFLDSGWASSYTNFVRFGVDLTPPTVVAGLKASPTTDTAFAGTVTAGTRTHITWLGQNYDSLSGVAYYQMLLDGSKAIPDEGDSQGRVIDVPGYAAPAATIEDLTPGKHAISVYAVDHAGNVGPATSTDVYSDPDTPTVNITAPSGSLIGANPTVSAKAGDRGGVRSMVLKLDGVQFATTGSCQCSAKADLSNKGSGSHVLTAVVTDMYGRVVTDTKVVTLDKTPLVLSAFSRSASLFYPIKRDGYKDNLTAKFTGNKACTAKLVVRKSSGATVRTITKTVPKGAGSIVWDGKWSSDGKAHTGTYTLQVTATDAAANSAATGKLKTSIRNYQVVKVGGSKIKIVAR